MTRPAVHRRSELFGISIGTSFNGFLGLVLYAPSLSRQYRLLRFLPFWRAISCELL